MAGCEAAVEAHEAPGRPGGAVKSLQELHAELTRLFARFGSAQSAAAARFQDGHLGWRLLRFVPRLRSPWPPFPSPSAAPRSSRKAAPTEERRAPAVIPGHRRGARPGRPVRERRVRRRQGQAGLHRRPHQEIEGKLAAARSSTRRAWMPAPGWCSAPPWTWKTRTAATKVTYQIVGDDEADQRRADLHRFAHRACADRQQRATWPRCRRRAASAATRSSTFDTLRLTLAADAARSRRLLAGPVGRFAAASPWRRTAGRPLRCWSARWRGACAWPAVQCRG